jgi:quinoprotein glucose dehydrogenase
MVPRQGRFLAERRAVHPSEYPGNSFISGEHRRRELGGAAWDPIHNLLIADTNRVAAIARLIPREDLSETVLRGKPPAQTSWGGEFVLQRGAPYAMYREWLIAPNGQPCNAPLWGAVVAFDLNTGKLRWETPLGQMHDGWPMGSISFGGPIASAERLVFTAAAMDPHLRAFDADTGRELWSAELPASAQSVPMTYELNGRQYLVICAGGHGKMKSKMGDSVVRLGLRLRRSDRNWIASNGVQQEEKRLPNGGRIRPDSALSAILSVRTCPCVLKMRGAVSIDCKCDGYSP